MLPISEKEKIISETFKEINFNGIIASIPESFPDNVASLNSKDLENIAYRVNTKNFRTTESDTFSEIIEKVKANYPDITNFDPKEYEKFFPKMSLNEIQKEQEMVLSFVESLMGYEIAVEFSKSSNKNLRVAYEANSCEKWFYAGHLRLDLGGMETAKDKAEQYAGMGYKDKSDANRNGVWNVYLGKYAAYRYALSA